MSSGRARTIACVLRKSTNHLAAASVISVLSPFSPDQPLIAYVVARALIPVRIRITLEYDTPRLLACHVGVLGDPDGRRIVGRGAVTSFRQPAIASDQPVYHRLIAEGGHRFTPPVLLPCTVRSLHLRN